ncbi:MAG: glycosyl transferase [Oscillospiraceae bacterium]|nr:glycosyl transferase [Oscillospiraceae bacterium]
MIPKTIHYCWFGGSPFPPLVERCMASWKKHCPGWEIIEWNESNYDVTKNEYMREAHTAKKWGFVPDYARLDIVYSHGGIYLDTDVELLKNLDALLTNKAFMGLEDKKYVAIGLGFGAVKGHETIKALRDCYDSMRFINDDGSYNMLPSPAIQTECLRKVGGGHKKAIKSNKIQTIADITIYPAEYFAPKHWIVQKTNITPNTYSIHHYAASWHDDNMRARVEYQSKLSRYVGTHLALLISAIKYYGWKETMKKVKKRLCQINR